MKGKIPYYDNDSAKELGFWIGEDAENLVGWGNHFNYPVVGYTYHISNGEEFEEEQRIDNVFHLIYMTYPKTKEFKSYSLKLPFLPEDQRL